MASTERGVKDLRVAIVHDWLVGGGAERVVYELHKMFPEAPIYTSYASPEWQERLDGKVVTGFLQRWPFSKLRKIMILPRIWWFTHLDLSDYDLVISSSGNGEAFSVRTAPGTTHICYCHSPTHYYWRHYDAYLRQPGFGFLDPLARIALRIFVAPLRRWDRKASKGPDFFIANSSHIQKDIKQYYGRESVVIFPPVDIARFKGKTNKRHGFVTVGRQVPNKRTDIIVSACTKLDLPLIVVGSGPEHERLKKLAGPSVAFVPDATDEEVTRYVQNAEAFIFASHDDFGITPIEAMAAGTPVVAFKAGGALDYIEEGKTGLFFSEQTVASLSKTLHEFDAAQFDVAYIREQATAFSPDIFREKLRALIDKVA